MDNRTLIVQNGLFNFYHNECEDGARLIVSIRGNLIDKDIFIESIAKFRSNKRIENLLVPISIENKELVFKYPKGRSLAKIEKGAPVDEEVYINIILNILSLLDEIHKQGYIHDYLTPEMFFYDEESNRVQLFFPGEIPVHYMTKDLKYIAPEKTGRLDCEVDYRSDYFSLGLIFLELLTGINVTKSNDPLEMVYQLMDGRFNDILKHMNDLYRSSLSSVIQKLIQIDPLKRYQSISEIVSDLLRCKIEFKDKKFNSKNKTNRSSMEFRITNNLINRQSEISVIIDQFNKVKTEGHSALFISGSAGIGKSYLLKSVIPELTTLGGVCIFGKYDQYNNEPYSAIKVAISHLVDHLLSLGESELNSLRLELLKILGVNGGIFLDVFPSFKRITGSLFRDKNISPQNSKTILNSIIIEVMQLIAIRRTPLVLVLDDLQWIDQASSILLNILFKMDKVTHFILLGAYRENEIGNEHFVSKTIYEIEEYAFNFTEIKLIPFNVEAINHLIKESFDLNNSSALSQIVYKKTKGIPFYIKLFLKSMYDDGILSFESGHFVCEINDALNSNITDNVAEIVLEKIDNLPNEDKNILSSAASLGNSFYFNELVIVTEQNTYLVMIIINKSIKNGFIVLESKNKSKEKYRFSHDKIQQAFYDLLSKEKKRFLHINIARKIYKQLDNKSLETRVFELLHHYNMTYNRGLDPAERVLISNLNLMAGEKALSSIAWHSAYQYLNKGIQALPNDNWKNNYDLSLKLYTKGAELALLNGEYTKMEEYISIVENNSINILDKVEVWKIMLQSMFARKNMPEAILLTQKYLELLNIKIPRDKRRVLKKIRSYKLRRRVRKLGIENFNFKDKMDNPEAEAGLEILIFATSSAYLSYPYMFQFLAMKMMDIIMKHGLINKGIFALLCYAQVLNDENRIDQSYNLGEKAKQLIDYCDYDYYQPRVYLFFGAFQAHWKRPIHESIKLLDRAYQLGIRNSDLEYVSHSLSVVIIYLFYSGLNLQQCLFKADSMIHELARFNQKRGLSACLRHKQIIKVFLGLTESYDSFSDSSYDEFRELETAIQLRDYNHIAIYYIYKMMIDYHYYNYEKALGYSRSISERALLSINGQLSVIIYYYYSCLTLISVYIQNGKKDIKSLICIKNYIKKVKFWAEHSPENHMHRYYFLSAEYNRIKRNFEEVIRLYNLAIDTAMKNNFVNDASVILEKFSLFFKEIKMYDQYRYYMKKSFLSYKQWGAEAKLDHLERSYNEISFDRYDKDFTIAKYFDYSAILEATQTISGEVIQEKLLKKVITTILKTTGAERVFFFLIEKAEIILKASGDLKENDIEFENQVSYATSVVDYVQRSGSSIIVNRNSDNLFHFDKYIIEKSPQSILCQPIKREKHCIGIIYLENNVSDTLFNDSISNIVNILSTQVAISIENANLYEELQNQYATQQRLEEENNEHLLELIHAEKLASVGFLIAEVAHEINNPNQAILLNAAHLKDFSSDILTIIDEYYQFDKDLWVGGIEYKEFKTLFSEITQSIEKSSIQINALINELKRFIYKDTNEQVVDVDLNSVISSTLIISSYYLKKATKHFEFIPGEIPKVKGNFQRFQQVILNLLRNSCQALNDRDGAIKITTVYPNGSKYIIIKISDEGCGISGEDLAKISEPFYTTKGKTGGSGLGLYISKSIISKAGGLFDITSQLGHGTTITISLPVVEYEKLSK